MCMCLKTLIAKQCIKMTITDQIKILGRKIIQNEAQYDLDRKAAKVSAFSSNNLDKYEYLTGEGLGLRPSTIEQTKFEYSPLGKIFNKALSKDDQKEGLFKRLKNIEGENKKESEPIKNEEQLKVIKDESTVADKKPKEIVLLKDKLDFILKNLAQILIILEKKFLIKLAKDEKKIEYNNLFFEIDSNSVVKSVDFLQEIGTLYDLLIYLLNNSMKIITSTETQIDSFLVGVGLLGG